jgi:hypothetical protein
MASRRPTSPRHGALRGTAFVVGLGLVIAAIGWFAAATMVWLMA